jgi:hypothetical protein
MPPKRRIKVVGQPKPEKPKRKVLVPKKPTAHSKLLKPKEITVSYGVNLTNNADDDIEVMFTDQFGRELTTQINKAAGRMQLEEAVRVMRIAIGGHEADAYLRENGVIDENGEIIYPDSLK